MHDSSEIKRPQGLMVALFDHESSKSPSSKSQTSERTVAARRLGNALVGLGIHCVVVEADVAKVEMGVLTGMVATGTQRYVVEPPPIPAFTLHEENGLSIAQGDIFSLECNLGAEPDMGNGRSAWSRIAEEFLSLGNSFECVVLNLSTSASYVARAAIQSANRIAVVGKADNSASQWASILNHYKALIGREPIVAPPESVDEIRWIAQQLLSECYLDRTKGTAPQGL